MGSEAYMLDPVHAADECFSQVERTKTGRPGKLCLDFDKEPFLFSTTAMNIFGFSNCVLHIIGSFAIDKKFYFLSEIFRKRRWAERVEFLCMPRAMFVDNYERVQLAIACGRAARRWSSIRNCCQWRSVQSTVKRVDQSSGQVGKWSSNTMVK